MTLQHKNYERQVSGWPGVPKVVWPHLAAVHLRHTPAINGPRRATPENCHSSHLSTKIDGQVGYVTIFLFYFLSISQGLRYGSPCSNLVFLCFHPLWAKQDFFLCFPVIYPLHKSGAKICSNLFSPNLVKYGVFLLIFLLYFLSISQTLRCGSVVTFFFAQSGQVGRVSIYFPAIFSLPMSGAKMWLCLQWFCFVFLSLSRFQFRDSLVFAVLSYFLVVSRSRS